MTKTIKPRAWASELSNGDITLLGHLSRDIDKELDKAASAFITIGNLLNQARKIFIGDKEFGQWRDQHTNIKSGKTASAYMAVARRFSVHSLAPKVSYSVLRELSSAPDDVVKEVEKRVDDGETPTVKDVQSLKRESATAPDPHDTPRDATGGPSSPSGDPTGTNLPGRGFEGQDGPPVASEGNTPTESKEPALSAGEYIMIAVSEDELALIIDALLANPTNESEELAKRLREEQ